MKYIIKVCICKQNPTSEKRDQSVKTQQVHSAMRSYKTEQVHKILFKKSVN